MDFFVFNKLKELTCNELSIIACFGFGGQGALCYF